MEQLRVKNELPTVPQTSNSEGWLKFCGACNKHLPHPKSAYEHYESKRHRNRIAYLTNAKMVESSYEECKVCCKFFSGPEIFAEHLASAKHLQKVDEVNKGGGILSKDTNKKSPPKKGTPNKDTKIFSSRTAKNKIKKVVKKAVIKNGFPLGGEISGECKVCSETFTNVKKLAFHFASSNHLKKLADTQLMVKREPLTREVVKTSTMTDEEIIVISKEIIVSYLLATDDVTHKKILELGSLHTSEDIAELLLKAVDYIVVNSNKCDLCCKIFTDSDAIPFHLASKDHGDRVIYAKTLFTSLNPKETVGSPREIAITQQVLVPSPLDTHDGKPYVGINQPSTANKFLCLSQTEALPSGSSENYREALNLHGQREVKVDDQERAMDTKTSNKKELPYGAPNDKIESNITKKLLQLSQTEVLPASSDEDYRTFPKPANFQSLSQSRKEGDRHTQIKNFPPQEKPYVKPYEPNRFNLQNSRPIVEYKERDRDLSNMKAPYALSNEPSRFNLLNSRPIVEYKEREMGVNISSWKEPYATSNEPNQSNIAQRLLQLSQTEVLPVDSVENNRNISKPVNFPGLRKPAEIYNEREMQLNTSKEQRCVRLHELDQPIIPNRLPHRLQSGSLSSNCSENYRSSSRPENFDCRIKSVIDEERPIAKDSSRSNITNRLLQLSQTEVLPVDNITNDRNISNPVNFSGQRMPVEVYNEREMQLNISKEQYCAGPYELDRPNISNRLPRRCQSGSLSSSSSSENYRITSRPENFDCRVKSRIDKESPIAKDSSRSDITNRLLQLSQTEVLPVDNITNDRNISKPVNFPGQRKPAEIYNEREMQLNISKEQHCARPYELDRPNIPKRLPHRRQSGSLSSSSETYRITSRPENFDCRIKSGIDKERPIAKDSSRSDITNRLLQLSQAEVLPSDDLGNRSDFSRPANFPDQCKPAEEFKEKEMHVNALKEQPYVRPFEPYQSCIPNRLPQRHQSGSLSTSGSENYRNISRPENFEDIRKSVLEDMERRTSNDPNCTDTKNRLLQISQMPVEGGMERKVEIKTSDHDELPYVRQCESIRSNNPETYRNFSKPGNFQCQRKAVEGNIERNVGIKTSSCESQLYPRSCEPNRSNMANRLLQRSPSELSASSSENFRKFPRSENFQNQGKPIVGYMEREMRINISNQKEQPCITTDDPNRSNITNRLLQISQTKVLPSDCSEDYHNSSKTLNFLQGKRLVEDIEREMEVKAFSCKEQPNVRLFERDRFSSPDRLPHRNWSGPFSSSSLENYCDFSKPENFGCRNQPGFSERRVEIKNFNQREQPNVRPNEGNQSNIVNKLLQLSQTELLSSGNSENYQNFPTEKASFSQNILNRGRDFEPISQRNRGFPLSGFRDSGSEGSFESWGSGQGMFRNARFQMNTFRGRIRRHMFPEDSEESSRRKYIRQINDYFPHY